jgi:hypothetical protein
MLEPRTGDEKKRKINVIGVALILATVVAILISGYVVVSAMESDVSLVTPTLNGSMTTVLEGSGVPWYWMIAIALVISFIIWFIAMGTCYRDH